MGNTIEEINILEEENKRLKKELENTWSMEAYAIIYEVANIEQVKNEELENKIEHFTKALEFYRLDDERSVEMGILENVDKRPATSALATPSAEETLVKLQSPVIAVTWENEQPTTETVCPCINGRKCMNCRNHRLGPSGAEHSFSEGNPPLPRILLLLL